MRMQVRAVIYFYIFICAVLLIFNLLYIFRSDRVRRRQQKKIRHWNTYLDSFAEGSPVWDSGKVFRRLQNIQELMAFHEALESRSQETEAFFRENGSLILALAKTYREKEAMEQAFFAYVVAAFYPPEKDQQDPLPEQLLGYLDRSTVYSRENVLSALYALGNIQPVEHAFLLMSQRGWYHDSRLLSDGLNRFQGEKELLAARLWSRRGQLTECFQVGILRFADTLSGDGFAENFLRALQTEQLATETRFALVRYFRRHAVPCARPVLLQLVKGETARDRELAIAAAASLASYPDDETRQVLKEALRSPNWYVRQNAARSLKILGMTWEETGIDSGKDRYAVEMLEYILGARPAAEEEKKEKEVLAAV